MNVETKQRRNTFGVTPVGSCELLTGTFEGRRSVEGTSAVSVVSVAGTAGVAALE